MKIGILGLQGCFRPHIEKLQKLAIDTSLVLSVDDFKDVDGLIVPGGESSTMLKLCPDDLWQAMTQSPIPVWGVCAGSILLAEKTINPEQKSLGLIDMDITRNAYGAQNESFVDEVTVFIEDEPQAIKGVFIRAPKISRYGKLSILAKFADEVVFIGACHPDFAVDLNSKIKKIT